MSLSMKTNFPGGNGQFLGLRTEGEIPELIFTPDARQGAEAAWFHFALHETKPEEVKPGGKVILTMRHFSNLPGAGESHTNGVRPVFRQENGDWTRLRAGKFVLEPDGQITLSWEVEAPAPRCEVALSFPYLRQDFLSFLKKREDYWLFEAIGLTGASRTLQRACNHHGTTPGQMSGIYILARQFAGENPGSWVLEGLMAELARLKRTNLLAWVVPFVDNDGVGHGVYGRGAIPTDWAQAWTQPARRPEVSAIIHDLHRWKDRCKPALLLDLQSPGCGDGDGIMAWLPSDCHAPTPLAEAEKWANVMGDSLGAEYAAKPFRRDPGFFSMGPTSATGWATRLGIPALALAIPYATAGEKVLSRKCYREAGQKIASSLVLRLRG